ncbi:WG repeat-containing protein [bacterium]|nr:WG repeat-containing protein [bacterium]MBU1959350.1 WG repeat-containing protein [bacterium]
MTKLVTLLVSLFIMGCSNTPKIKDKIHYPDQFISQEYLKTLDFQGKELIAVPIGTHFYYIRKDGKKMLTLTYDNGADAFSDGLARTKINGKIGFFNRNLEIVLNPVYDFAFPFHNGIAEICMGCKEKQEGEHSMLDGGEWKKIDRNGLLIE